jgi:iron complex transport system ATP-binding protein
MKTKDLSLCYDTNLLLKDLNIEFLPDEIISFLGENGSGKSSLIKTLLGLNPHHTGEIFFENKNWLNQSPQYRAKISAAVFSQTHVHGSLSILDFLGLGNEHSVENITKIFTSKQLELKLSQDFNSLSDGEKQILSLTRATLQDPQFLFLDEPTSHLDPFHTLDFIQTLKHENTKNNRTVLWSTHRWNLALEHSHKILVFLNKGDWWFGTPSDCLNQKILQQLIQSKSYDLNQFNSLFKVGL